MAEAAGRRPLPRAGGGPHLPEEIVVWEILVRLPAKPLLRCRAVCRSWRRLLSSDPDFLLAHHRRQPSFMLVEYRDNLEGKVDVLDHLAGERRPVVRTTTADGLGVVASCDGLLILHAYGGFHICNPATRQRAPLPLLLGTNITGLYRHCPSGSYRVLCWMQRPQDAIAEFYVHTVGSAELRCIGKVPEPRASGQLVEEVSPMDRLSPPFPVGLLFKRGCKRKNVLVFDPVAESFQQILSPVESSRIKLFGMKGTLGFFNNGGYTADLWVLQDYEHQVWSFKYRIMLPIPIISLVLDAEGDVLLVSSKGRSGYRWPCLQHMSGTNGSLLTRYQWDHCLNLTRLSFKESLVQHAFFPMEGNCAVNEQPLFEGLSTAVVLRDDNSKLD